MTKKQKTIIYSVATIMVWGLAISQFVLGMGNSSIKNQEKLHTKTKLYTIDKLEKVLKKIILKKKTVVEYKGTGSDPFGGYELLQLKSKEEKVSSKVEKEIIVTQLRLTGTLWDTVKPYAYIVHNSGKEYQKTIGDKIGEETIIDIKPDYIITKRAGVKFKITTSGFETLPKK